MVDAEELDAGVVAVLVSAEGYGHLVFLLGDLEVGDAPVELGVEVVDLGVGLGVQHDHLGLEGDHHAALHVLEHLHGHRVLVEVLVVQLPQRREVPRREQPLLRYAVDELVARVEVHLLRDLVVVARIHQLRCCGSQYLLVFFGLEVTWDVAEVNVSTSCSSDSIVCS